MTSSSSFSGKKVYFPFHNFKENILDQHQREWMNDCPQSTSQQKRGTSAIQIWLGNFCIFLMTTKW